MCFVSGTFFVANGFRPAIVKKGHKWAFVMFLDGGSVRCKKMKLKRMSRPAPIVGETEYTTSKLAAQFLSPNRLTGKARRITKQAKLMLNQARS